MNTQTLLKEIEQLQATALASTDTNVAEIARLRIDLADAKAAEEKALKKAKYAEDNRDFLTEQYQNASRSAADLGEQNTLLSSSLAAYKKKADAEAVKITYDRTKASIPSLVTSGTPQPTSVTVVSWKN